MLMSFSTKFMLSRRVLLFCNFLCCKYGPVFHSNRSERHCFSCWFTTWHLKGRYLSGNRSIYTFCALSFKGGRVIISYWNVHSSLTGLFVRNASLSIMIILISAALVHSTHGFWLWCYKGGMIASIHLSFVCWCGIYIK